jgi:ferrous iron transport protein A
MMPLTFAKAGEKNSIKKISGKDEVKRFLNNLGFVEGGEITVVSENAGNLIVNVKEARIAISREMANRIIV